MAQEMKKLFVALSGLPFMGFIKDIRDSTKSLVKGVRIIGDASRTLSDIGESLSKEGGPLGFGIIELITDVSEDRPAPEVVEKAQKVRKGKVVVTTIRNVKKKVTGGVVGTPTGTVTGTETEALELWLEAQKEKGKDTMATRMAEKRLGLRD